MRGCDPSVKSLPSRFFDPVIGRVRTIWIHPTLAARIKASVSGATTIPTGPERVIELLHGSKICPALMSPLVEDVITPIGLKVIGERPAGDCVDKSRRYHVHITAPQHGICGASSGLYGALSELSELPFGDCETI